MSLYTLCATYTYTYAYFPSVIYMYQTSKVDPDPKIPVAGRPFLGGVQAALDGTSTSQEGTSPWHEYPHAHPHSHSHSQQQHVVLGQSLSVSVEEESPSSAAVRVLLGTAKAHHPLTVGATGTKAATQKVQKATQRAAIATMAEMAAMAVTKEGSAAAMAAPRTAVEYEEAAEAWAEAGLAEHASVASFAHVTLQLMAVGAPPDILKVGYYGRSLPVWVMVL